MRLIGLMGFGAWRGSGGWCGRVLGGGARFGGIPFGAALHFQFPGLGFGGGALDERFPRGLPLGFRRVRLGLVPAEEGDEHFGGSELVDGFDHQLARRSIAVIAAGHLLGQFVVFIDFRNRGLQGRAEPGDEVLALQDGTIGRAGIGQTGREWIAHGGSVRDFEIALQRTGGNGGE